MNTNEVTKLLRLYIYFFLFQFYSFAITVTRWFRFAYSMTAVPARLLFITVDFIPFLRIGDMLPKIDHALWNLPGCHVPLHPPNFQ